MAGNAALAEYMTVEKKVVCCNDVVNFATLKHVVRCNWVSYISVNCPKSHAS